MQPILAIDLGKNKSVFCDYAPQNGQHQFGTVPTSPQEIHDLLLKYPQHLVVIEICPHAGWIADLCLTLGRSFKAVNTTGEEWKWNKVKDKSDRLDRRGERWPAGKKGWTQAALDKLQQMARTLAECDGEELWRGMIHEELAALRHTRQRLAEVDQKLDTLAAASPRVQRLKTVPAVGNRTAEIVVAMLDDAKRFKNVSQAGSYTGLTPRRLQSGSMDRQTGISHAGNRLLRKMLVQAAWIGQLTNPWMQETYERVSGGKKDRKKKAIVAVARQLFVRLWAMDRDGKDWNGPAAVTPAWRTRKRTGPVVVAEELAETATG